VIGYSWVATRNFELSDAFQQQKLEFLFATTAQFSRSLRFYIDILLHDTPHKLMIHATKIYFKRILEAI